MRTVLARCLDLRVAAPVLAFVVVWASATEPAYPALDCAGAGSSIDGSGSACAITFTATIAGTISLNVVGGSAPATAMPAQAIAFGSIDATCTDPVDTGACSVMSSTNGAYWYGSLDATITYSGCGANSGTLGMTRDPAAGTPFPGEVRVQAGTVAGYWTTEDNGILLANEPLALQTNIQTGMTSGVAFSHQLAVEVLTSDAAGGPYTQTIYYDAGCT